MPRLSKVLVLGSGQPCFNFYREVETKIDYLVQDIRRGKEAELKKILQRKTIIKGVAVVAGGAAIGMLTGGVGFAAIPIELGVAGAVGLIGGGGLVGAAGGGIGNAVAKSKNKKKKA